MAGKLFVVFAALAIVAISCAQANIGKYVDAPATGEHQVRQQCFVRYVLLDAVNRYGGGKLEQELSGDLAETENYLAGRKSEGSSGAKTCYSSSAFDCSIIGAKTTSTWEEIPLRSSADRLCYQWSKFARLCHLIRARKSNDLQSVTIQEWVCQVSADSERQFLSNAFFGQIDRICPEKVRQSAEEQANMQFPELAAYSQEDLEKAKEALGQVISGKVRPNLARHSETDEQVRGLIKERVAKHFDAFDSCWANKDLQEAAKRNKNKGGVFGKVFRCIGSLC